MNDNCATIFPFGASTNRSVARAESNNVQSLVKKVIARRFERKYFSKLMILIFWSRYQIYIFRLIEHVPHIFCVLCSSELRRHFSNPNRLIAYKICQVIFKTAIGLLVNILNNKFFPNWFLCVLNDSTNFYPRISWMFWQRIIWNNWLVESNWILNWLYLRWHEMGKNREIRIEKMNRNYVQ